MPPEAKQASAACDVQQKQCIAGARDLFTGRIVCAGTYKQCMASKGF